MQLPVIALVVCMLQEAFCTLYRQLKRRKNTQMIHFFKKESFKIRIILPRCLHHENTLGHSVRYTL